MKKKKITVALKLIVGLTLITLLFSQVNWPDLAIHVNQISPLHLIALLITGFSMIAISCWKWKVLLSSQGLPISFPCLFSSYFVGYLFTNFLPGNTGGDVIRAYRIGEKTGQKVKSFLSVFLERFTGLIVLLCWIVISPSINPNILKNKPLMIMVLAAGCLLILISLFLFRRKEISRILLSSRFLKNAFQNIIKNIDASKPSGKTITKVMTITIIFYLLTILNVYLAFLTFRINVSVVDISALIPLIMFISMLPVSINAIGLSEGAYVYCFLLAGIPKEASLCIALLMRLKLILFGLIGGVVYLYSSKPQKLDVPDGKLSHF